MSLLTIRGRDRRLKWTLIASFVALFIIGSVWAADKSAEPDAVRAEKIRAKCLAGRRMICGRVLKVLPEGLVVESGYTNLMRKELEGSWHMPRTVVASRPPNLVESQEPDSPCVGTVYITGLPKPRGGGKVKVNAYDYVVLRGYPAGTFTFNSTGDVRRMVRRFATGLDTAAKLTLDASEKKPPPAS